MFLTKAASARQAIQAMGVAFVLCANLPAAISQPTVDIGLFPSTTDGVVEVRLRATGNFNQLLSNMVFTISWPASSGVTLDDSHLISLCDLIPIVPNGDGVQQSGGMRYQTYFMLGFQSLSSGCPLVSGQELTVMRIPLLGLTSCTNLNIADDGYTGSHNKDYYISLNGMDRTGAIYSGPVSECVCTAIKLDITTDSHPHEIGWQIRNAATGISISAGTVPASQTNRTVHLSTCLSQGCYRLTMTDAGSNGISGGGYILRQGENRIIDATGAFGSTSEIADNGTFCLPLGPTFLKPVSCDLTGVAANDILQAKKLPTANAYGFEIFDPHGTFDTTVYRTGPKLKFVQALWNKVPHDLPLDLRVNAGTSGTYGNYGKVCGLVLGGSGGMALGIDEAEVADDAGLVVYPNPILDDSFHLLFGDEEDGADHATIELYSCAGQRLSIEEVNFQGRLDHVVYMPENAVAGLYMVIFTTADRREMRLVEQP